VLREGIKKMGPVVTDNGNFIIDVRWPETADVEPKVLEDSLNKITGIVENGFFTKNTPRVFIIHQDGKIEDI